MAGKVLFLELSGDCRGFALNNSLKSTFCVVIGISVFILQ